MTAATAATITYCASFYITWMYSFVKSDLNFRYASSCHALDGFGLFVFYFLLCFANNNHHIKSRERSAKNNVQTWKCAHSFVLGVCENWCNVSNSNWTLTVWTFVKKFYTMKSVKIMKKFTQYLLSTWSWKVFGLTTFHSRSMDAMEATILLTSPKLASGMTTELQTANGARRKENTSCLALE